MQAQIPNMDPSKMAVLNATVAQLNKDTSKLFLSKSPAGLKRTMNKVQNDFHKVQAIVSDVVTAAETSEPAKNVVALKPIEHIRAFLDKNPQITRKDAVAALIEQGINPSTARTQYHRWKAARGK